MTDSPNLELAEEIEALCAPHYACGVPPISSQNSTINSGWLQTGQHLPTCPIAIAAKIRALRAQPSGDWVMTVYEMCEQHKGITSYSVTLGSGGHVPAKKVCPICEQLSAAKERGRG